MTWLYCCKKCLRRGGLLGEKCVTLILKTCISCLVYHLQSLSTSFKHKAVLYLNQEFKLLKQALNIQWIY